MNIFISGGCKNGKSMYAQNITKEMAAKRGTALYYLATMQPVDEEDLTRIQRHVEERKGWGFTTLEQSQDICKCLERAELNGAFLLDSVTALLSNEMFRRDGTVDRSAPSRVAADLKKFAALTGNTVFVSDYIYGDAARYDEFTDAYRQGLALIDRSLAAICERVIEVSFGHVIEYKEYSL